VRHSITIREFSRVQAKAGLTDVEAAALNGNVHRKVTGKLSLLQSREAPANNQRGTTMAKA
jgi:hypothetical protein